MNILKILNLSKIFTRPHSNFSSNQVSYYQESKQFWRQPSKESKIDIKPTQHTQQLLLNYILEHCPKNNPLKTIEYIDKFCNQNWMMNIGPEKRKILEKVISGSNIKNVLQIGTYCGYSALVLSQAQLKNQSRIVSFQINKKIAEIAKKILSHAGIKNVNIVTQKIQDSISYLNENGPFDLVFMDQEQQQYVQDLSFLQERNFIRAGSIIITDNIIYPGAPQFLTTMKHKSEQQKYKNILYHTYDGYTDIPDAVLVSEKIY